MATIHAHPRTQTPPRDYNATNITQSLPILTNPDMILPYRESYSSPTTHASSPTYDTTLTSSLSRHNVPKPYPSSAPAEVGVARSFAVPLRIKPPAQTTITYPPQNYEHGAPLSVIGEEESTPKSKRSKSRSPSPGADSSPTNGSLSAQRRARRFSGQSESSLGSDIVKWEEFDGPPIANARLKADLSNDKEDVIDLEGIDNKRGSGVASDDDDMKRAERILANAKKRLTKMEDNLTKARTSILISPRSSPIMGEHQPAGGLYRSISLGGDRKLNQGGHLRRSKQFYPVIQNVTSGHSRVLSETSVPSGSVSLSRVPEIRSASALDYSSGNTVGTLLQSGSPTAHSPGLSPASVSSRSFNTPLKALREEDASPSSFSTDRTSPGASVPRGLGITTHSGFVEENTAVGGDNPVVNENSLARSHSQASNRSARDLRDQMLGLKSKVIDLKARAQADSLRRRSLQNVRASSPYEQAAEQWYAGAAEYKAGESPLSTNAGLGWSPQREQSSEYAPPTSPRDDSATLGMEPNGTLVTSPAHTRTDVNTPTLHHGLSKRQPGRDGEDSPRQPSHYEDAFEESSSDPDDAVAASEEEQIYLNEALEESLHEAEPELSALSEDVVELSGEPERHEDRVDAFDYENMFLHSALGNYSQPAFHRRNSSSNSDDSETSNLSIETARAAAATEELEEAEMDAQSSSDSERLDSYNQGRLGAGHYETSSSGELPTPTAPRAPWTHSRSKSTDSVSTTATFATATEGGGESEPGSDAIPKEILSWGSQSSILNSVGGFPTPPSSSTILGMQSRAARKGSSPLVTSISPSGPETTSPGRSRGFAAELPTPPEISPKKIPGPNYMKSQQRPTQAQRPADTEILMASLITLADPSFRHRPADSPNGSSTDMFTNVDKDLVLTLLRSVGAACSNILTSDRRGEVYESRVWRRRLDAARKILSGEFEIEED